MGGFNMIHLEKLTYENFDDVFELKVKKDQYGFVASNCYSIAEAYITMISGGQVFPFAIYNDKKLVGFIQIGYGENADQDGVSVEKDNYEIWRFMIDKRFQGRGYGKDALKLALDFIRTWPCGKADLCWISYEPENEIAKKLYSSFGFVETGEMDGDEIVAVLKL
jgi:diamine N-acetyltransferase